MGKSSTFIQPFINSPSASSWAGVRWSAISRTWVFFDKPRGEVQKCPLKISDAWAIENGPDIRVGKQSRGNFVIDDVWKG